MSSAAVYEASRPCPKCSRDVDLRNVKPGSSTTCPHCYRELGGKQVRVTRRKRLHPVYATPPPADPAAAVIAPGWDDEPPGVLDWPGPLGPECPEAPRCDDDCGCSSPPIRYTADHAGTVCPECGPGCWSVPPPSINRGRAHAAAAAPARTASTPAAQAELDDAARKLERDRAMVLDGIGRWRALPGLTLANVSDLDWYAAEAGQPSISRTRLRELAAQLNATTAAFVIEPEPEPEPRRWWQRSAAELDDDDDQDQADELDDDQDDDDAPPELTAEQRARVARYLRRQWGLPEPFRPVPGVVYGPGGAVLSVPAGISPAGIEQLRAWNRRASGL